MEQNTSEWLAWRAKGIGSSDAPVIMGVPHPNNKKTLAKLYDEKIQTTFAEEKSNFIFEKGHRLEDIVRARLELQMMIDLAPKLFERTDKPYIRASMDGANTDESYGIECKYVGKDIFIAGVCPEYYYPQIMHQYLCTGFKKIDLVLITDNKELCGEKDLLIKIVEVPLDQAYCEKLFKACVNFMENHIMKKKRPELSDGDAMPIKDLHTRQLLKSYAKKKAQSDKLSDELEVLKSDIIKSVDEKYKHPLLSYGEIRITSSERKGNLDYKKLPMVKEFLDKATDDELDKYRAKSSIIRSIKC